jgi:GntR family phosphonate transport system transcriptional regulator
MPFAQLSSSAPGRRSGVTVWRQIADTLTTEIRNRSYADTGRLPGEVELSARFAVNRHTLRQAVAALQTEGLVRIEPGRGMFVQHELLDYALSRRTRFSENLLRQGLLPSKQLLTAREIPAPERAAKELGLDKGSAVLMVETLDEANDAPIGLATAYYPAQRFAGLLEMLAQGTRTTDILKHLVCKTMCAPTAASPPTCPATRPPSCSSSRKPAPCCAWRAWMPTWTACPSNTAKPFSRATGCSWW